MRKSLRCRAAGRAECNENYPLREKPTLGRLLRSLWIQIARVNSVSEYTRQIVSQHLIRGDERSVCCGAVERSQTRPGVSKSDPELRFGGPPSPTTNGGALCLPPMPPEVSAGSESSRALTLTTSAVHCRCVKELSKEVSKEISVQGRRT
jgi:hypothetical protein